MTSIRNSNNNVQIINDEILDFINDVYNYLKDEVNQFKCSNDNHFYENEFHKFITINKTNEINCKQLLIRCEGILKNFVNKKCDGIINGDYKNDLKHSVPSYVKTPSSDYVYLEMRSIDKELSSIETPSYVSEYIDFNNFNNELKSTNLINNDDHNDQNGNDDDDNDDYKSKIYDICENSNENQHEIASINNFTKEKTTDILKVNSNDTDNDSNEIICPYFNLPVSQIHNPNNKIIKFGHLYRFEKRFIFDQFKKCYCCILSDWFLCYSHESKSLHPTIYIKLKGDIKVELCKINNSNNNNNSNTNGGGSISNENLNIFQIIDKNNLKIIKRFQFKTKNHHNALEWIAEMEKIIISNNFQNKKKKKCSNVVPTTPEGVYEEPINPIGLSKNSNTNTIQYDKPPDLNKSNASSNTNNNCNNDNGNDEIEKEEINYVYDIPFSMKSTKQLLLNDSNDMNINNEKHKQQLQSTPISTPTTSKCNKDDFQNKIKDIHVKLTSQLSSGIKLDELKKSQVIEKQYKSSSDTGNSSNCRNSTFNNNNRNNDIDNTLSLSSPVKNWFLNRLNRTSTVTSSSSSLPETSVKYNKNKSKIKDKKIFKNKTNCTKNIQNFENDENLQENNDYDLTSEMKITMNKSSAAKGMTSTKSDKIKGYRINTIISQLEANGHLPQITKSLNRSNFKQCYDNDNNHQDDDIIVNNTVYDGYEMISTFNESEKN